MKGILPIMGSSLTLPEAELTIPIMASTKIAMEPSEKITEKMFETTLGV